MVNEIFNSTNFSALGAGAAPVGGPLPTDLVFSERAVAALRSYLIANGLTEYRIFFCREHDLNDIEDCLESLEESRAAWEALPASVLGGEALDTITCTSDDTTRLWNAGCMRLPRHEVVLARWYWVDSNCACIRALWLCAAPTPEQFQTLRTQVRQFRRANAKSVWQIVRSGGYCEDERRPRDTGLGEEIVFPGAIRQRLEMDVVRFFSDDVAKLYQSLRVSYRRGVLLHGPPGNGKTSLIRMLGTRLKDIPMMLLRPCVGFDGDDLTWVIDRWTHQAPAVLVIEDLDWLLKEVNVSTFLNLLDGIESTVTRGLLLIATTNHPEALNPAVNNRPGRFDVVIEVPCPDRAARLAFFTRKLPEIPVAAIEEAARKSEGLSYAHLQEILRLSGLSAIAANRDSRSESDLLKAAQSVQNTHEEARRGFPAKSETPFGLAARRKSP